MKNICIDARYIRPQMDGIGRYLFNLIDQLSLIDINYNNYKYFILEIEKFSKDSILRGLDNRTNITFIKLPVQPQTIKNHFISTYIKKYQIDLYHYGQFDLPWFLPAPTITTIHDLNPQAFPNFFNSFSGKFKKQYAIFSNWIALYKSEYVIAISESTKNDIISLYGEKYKNKIKVIYEGVNEKLLNLQQKEKYLNRLQDLKKINGLTKYLIYVGNNRPHKNLKNILLAFKKLKNEHNIDHKFLFIGKHYEEKYLDVKKFAKELNLQDDIILLSCNEDDLISYYLGATCLVFCSLSEGFGLPILEAMALGIPVITSNLSSMKEISNGSAYLVNPFSIDDITSGILKCIADDMYRNQIIIKGLNNARSFLWTNTAEETLKLYSSIIYKNKNK